MSIESRIEERKKRWASLYIPEGKKRKFVYIVDCPSSIAVGGVPLWREYKQERIEVAWRGYLAGREHVEQVDDDFIPFLNCVSGTEIFAEAFGCRVFRPTDNMPFAIPFVKSPSDAEKVKLPKLEDSPLMLQFEIADELVRRAGKDALLGLPDMQSPMDIVAQMWDKTDLFASMIEEPEAVKELAEKAKTLQEQFLDEWFRRYGKEFIAHHPSYYMPCGITMSVDEIGSVSPAMFEEFFRDELNELSDRYGGIGIHSCSDSVHQWENLAKVRNLRLLNLYRPQEVIDRAYEFFSPICAHWHGALVNNLGAPLRQQRAEAYPEGCRAVLREWAPSVEAAGERCRALAEMIRV